MIVATQTYGSFAWHNRSNVFSASSNRQNLRAKNPRFAIWCLEWFEFSSDFSEGSKAQIHTGDFKVLSHLKELGCGDLLCRPKPIYFRGCINESYKISCTGGDYFVKINRSFKAEELFEGEHDGLQKLHVSHSVRVPSPFGYGDLPDGGSYIIMEHLQFRPFGMIQEKSQEILGTNLAALHQYNVGDKFGFASNTRLGIMPLENGWASSWRDFFMEKRLKDRLKRVYSALGEGAGELQSKENSLLKKAEELLGSYTCKPSLLHGDLWV